MQRSNILFSGTAIGWPEVEVGKEDKQKAEEMKSTALSVLYGTKYVNGTFRFKGNQSYSEL